MKLLLHFALLSCAIAGCQSFAVAQTSNHSISEINIYSAEVERFTQINKEHRIFGDVSSAKTDKTDLWREFKSEKELEDTGNGENLNQMATLWTKQGKVIAAKFNFTSPSGDWNHFINYYFRENGSLAKIDAQLNTFEGNISVVRQRYYNSTGPLIKSTETFRDLETHKPRKSADFMDNPIPIYLKVPDLPFHQLL
ncbi:MAG TPA: hypothetical protein VJ372_03365 [Pyrinomonadaceae bacterium]|jgi:hypothetical protein|nr:hypothetical protein [Pyrinomonadaceae bacterium]